MSKVTVEVRIFAATTRQTKAGATQYVQVSQIDQEDTPAVQLERTTMNKDQIQEPGVYEADLHLYTRHVPGKNGFAQEQACFSLRNLRKAD